MSFRQIIMLNNFEKHFCSYLEKLEATGIFTGFSSDSILFLSRFHSRRKEKYLNFKFMKKSIIIYFFRV